jgi:hypothetical protein
MTKQSRRTNNADRRHRSFGRKSRIEGQRGAIIELGTKQIGKTAVERGAAKENPSKQLVGIA